MTTEYTPFINDVNAIADLYTTPSGQSFIEKGNFGNDLLYKAADGYYGADVQAGMNQLHTPVNSIPAAPEASSPIGVNNVWETMAPITSTPWWTSPTPEVTSTEVLTE